MKFQKYLIFNLWVCVTDSPRCQSLKIIVSGNFTIQTMIMMMIMLPPEEERGLGVEELPRQLGLGPQRGRGLVRHGGQPSTRTQPRQLGRQDEL